MKKSVFGRKLKRDKNERKALFKSLMSAFIMNGRITTSEAKAKAVRAEIEKLVTKAKNGSNAAKLVIEKSLTKDAFEKMVREIGPLFEKRTGGYTRLIKLGERFGDNSPVVIMEWTEEIKAIVPVQAEKKVKPAKKEKVEKPVKKVAEKKPVKKTVKKTK